MAKLIKNSERFPWKYRKILASHKLYKIWINLVYKDLPIFKRTV